MKIIAGLLDAAEFVLSPNHDERPTDIQIDSIIIHGISLPAGEFGGQYINDLFMNQLDYYAHPTFPVLEKLKVSSHCLIRRGGEIIQYVPFMLRAWHAGESKLHSRENCNDFSIGIELEGTDHIPYTSEQYVTLVELIAVLQQTYPGITRDRIVGHCDVAPKRKTDPGPAFDWNFLRQAIAV